MNKFSKLTAAVRTQKASSGIFAAAVIAAILVVNIIIYIFATTFGWYFYTTETLDLSVSESSGDYFAATLSELEASATGKVKINFLMAKDDLEVHNPGMYVHQTAVNLAEAYPDLIEVEYINIYTQINSKGEVVDLSKYLKNEAGQEMPIFKTSVIFTYNGQNGENYRVITDYNTSDGFSSFFTLNANMTVTSYNGEEVMAAMVGWVMRDKHPTAYITTGHGESTSQTMTVMLACAGYNVQAINLRGLTLDEELSLTEDPDTLLIISNPTSDFGRASASSDVRDEIEKLETYLGRGGHLYVSIDPYVSHKQILNLTSFLENYGISIATSTPDGVTLRNIVKDSSNAITLDGYTVVAGFAESDVAGKIKATAEKYGSGKILVREAAAIVCSEGERGSAYPLLVSSDSSVCEVGGTVVDNSGSYCVAAGATVPVEGAAPGGIFVISTAYIAASDAVNTDGYSNKDFVYAVLDEIMNAKTPPYGCTSIVYDTGTLEGLTMGTANIYTAIAIVIPALIALAGVVIITKRKNR